MPFNTGTAHGLAGYLRSKAKERTDEKGYEDSEMTTEYLEAKIEPLTCELTGLKLRLNRDRAYDPLSPSMDRKDNSKGYTKDNTQIVAYGINILRNQFSDEEVDILVNAWLNRDKALKAAQNIQTLTPAKACWLKKIFNRS